MKIETIKNFIKQFSGFFAFVGILFIMIGACMGDNENLLPTIICVVVGALFVLLHKATEEKEKEN